MKLTKCYITFFWFMEVFFFMQVSGGYVDHGRYEYCTFQILAIITFRIQHRNERC